MGFHRPVGSYAGLYAGSYAGETGVGAGSGWSGVARRWRGGTAVTGPDASSFPERGEEPGEMARGMCAKAVMWIRAAGYDPAVGEHAVPRGEVAALTGPRSADRAMGENAWQCTPLAPVARVAPAVRSGSRGRCWGC
ncbi:hypothetical protein GCM10022252_01700 [Streptosporangium oxazolinicum]|uniref:Uncharacterized protein n=1 Tax=Streptosporangium oxazolinicum TaxID=909287 RepID=A0ABP8A8F5_9ACTN